MNLLEQADEVYRKNFPNSTWFGKCIFISWYCDVGTCKFCYRSTIKKNIKSIENARRTPKSIFVEALLAKQLGWRIEFLTGGYNIYPIEKLVDITKRVSEIYNNKLWLNLGVLKEEDLKLLKPYTEGIVASIETINTKLHDKICPNKPIDKYEEMLTNSKNLKKSIAIVIGLGEKDSDMDLLFDFIKKHKLDRITFYALKPVKGTPYTKGPTTDEYLKWVANTRINFPKLEIITGTTANRVNEISLLLKAGSNAITKFPATKLFNSEKARIFEQEIKKSGRIFLSTLTDVNKLKELKNIEIESNIKEKLIEYIEVMEKLKS
ncbi:MAG: radical SAM protein [Nanoarchaeota archaeon]|nr:radical SAM protein [Nanoarchaeota archaeon]MBU0963045.1 radical SAM protein [Nanoarchaeota archaeon]